MATNSFFTRLSDAFGDFRTSIEDYGSDVTERNRMMNVRLIEMAQENTVEGIEAAKAVLNAKDVSEVFDVQRSFVQGGFSRGVQQSQEVMGLMSDATAAAFEPFRTALKNARATS